MIEPAAPADEATRVAQLRALRILDTPAEEPFERLARLTARVLDAPIAHISLIDEHREWLKAGVGVSVCEDERRTSFCAHTILADRILVVEDACRDPRFRDNPKVTGGDGIRFYAGAPLRTRAGAVVGVLSIKDRTPRTLTDDQLTTLRDLACTVIDAIEYRAAAAELRRWEFVFNHVDWGIAIANADSDTFDRVNPGFCAMHGYGQGELHGKRIGAVFAPEFRDEARRQQTLVKKNGRAVFEALHLRKDGTTFPASIDVVAVRDDSGDVLYRAAFVQDVTERRRLDEELRLKNAVLRTQQETSLDGILIVDPAGRTIDFNQRFAEMWNTSPEMLVTMDPDQGLERARQQVSEPERFLETVRYLSAHPDESTTDQLQMKDGRVLDRHSAPMLGPNGERLGRVWYVRDVTDRVRTERSLRESENRLSGVLESAMDAIVTIDEHGKIKLFNAAAQDTFRCKASEALGRKFERFTTPGFAELLENCRRGFRRRPSGHRYVWAPEGLTARRADGGEFPIEATLSQVNVGGERLTTIILRDVDERVAAERAVQSLQAQNLYLREEVQSELGFEEIIARSRPMLQVLESARQVAGTESSVLLLGETGTGKELIARAVHRLSGRRGKMMVKVNCAALPAGLIESELFGHEKGAFTGALQRKIGRFELADGGTIFLDEVGDLPLELQAKLLRVLQEGEFERVGGSSSIRVDARLIAATNRDLAAEVAAGRYRADLYYRLNVFPVEIPPLRDRPDDVPLLVHHFAMKHGARIGRKINRVSSRAMAALRAYDWPGNVRELQNVIERAVILSKDGQLAPAALLPAVRSSAEGRASRLDEVEKRHILSVLDRTGWRVSGMGGAAEILGLKRTTLDSRMKKLGIVRPGAARPHSSQ